MRILVDSSEEDLPEDILKLNETLRNQYQSWAISLRQRARLYGWPEGEHIVSEGDAIQRRFGVGGYLLKNLDSLPDQEGLPSTPLKTDFLNVSKPSASPPLPLERWQIEAHAYAEDQAGKVGILGRLFSGEAKRVKAGVIHDAKCFSEVKTESGKVEVGVAIRLAVATSRVSAQFELTLPNLAADAQLNGAEARVGITVIGYTGPLGDILPAPRKLDVETCAEYMEAFRKIQAKIFGEAGWQYVVPTTLSFDK